MDRAVAAALALALLVTPGLVRAQLASAPSGVKSEITSHMSADSILYQSKAGFVGQDSFKYRRTTPDIPNDRSAGDINYTITVK
jgi:hypothetical protein